MKDQELKNCPFCGRDKVRVYIPSSDEFPEPQVVCDLLGCEIWGPAKLSKSEAIVAWNRRADSPQLKAAREALEKIARMVRDSNSARWELVGDITTAALKELPK